MNIMCDFIPCFQQLQNWCCDQQNHIIPVFTGVLMGLIKKILDWHNLWLKSIPCRKWKQNDNGWSQQTGAKCQIFIQTDNHFSFNPTSLKTIIIQYWFAQKIEIIGMIVKIIVILTVISINSVILTWSGMNWRQFMFWLYNNKMRVYELLWFWLRLRENFAKRRKIGVSGW